MLECILANLLQNAVEYAPAHSRIVVRLQEQAEGIWVQVCNPAPDLTQADLSRFGERFWRKSPGHDANLRMKEATRFGIALAKDPQTRYRAWWALVVAGEPEKRVEISAGPVGWFGSNRPPR